MVEGSVGKTEGRGVKETSRKAASSRAGLGVLNRTKTKTTRGNQQPQSRIKEKGRADGEEKGSRRQSETESSSELTLRKERNLQGAEQHPLARTKTASALKVNSAPQTTVRAAKHKH